MNFGLQKLAIKDFFYKQIQCLFFNYRITFSENLLNYKSTGIIKLDILGFRLTLCLCDENSARKCRYSNHFQTDWILKLVFPRKHIKTPVLATDQKFNIFAPQQPWPWTNAPETIIRLTLTAINPKKQHYLNSMFKYFLILSFKNRTFAKKLYVNSQDARCVSRDVLKWVL